MKLLSIFYFCQMTGPLISPLTPKLYYSILSLLLSHHPSPPNFQIRPCFSNVMLDAQTPASQQCLTLSLSDSSSLPLGFCVLVSWSSSPLCVSHSLLFSIALQFNLYVSISHGSTLTRMPIALRDTYSPFFFLYTHIHTHTNMLKPLSLFLSYSHPHFMITSIPFSPFNPLLFSQFLIRSSSSSRWLFKPFHSSNGFS